MARLRGTGIGAGLAMGTAAVVRVVNGIAIAPQPPLRLANEVAFRRLSELPEIILVSPNFEIAQAIAPSISWAKVAGYAIEQISENLPVSATPLVMGVRDLMEFAQDDVLTLLDASRGIVLIDPDPVYLAQYTAEHDKIAPKHRFSLDDEDQPAVTVDGKTILLITSAYPHPLLATKSGADTLYFEVPADFLLDKDALILETVKQTGGKPLIISGNSQYLPLRAILEASAIVDITVLVECVACSGSDSDSNSLLRIRELKDLIAEAETACFEDDAVSGVPRIGVDLNCNFGKEYAFDSQVLNKFIGDLNESGVSRIVFTGGFSKDLVFLERLETLVSLATKNMIGVYCWLSDDGRSEPEINLDLIFGCGFSGVCTSNTSAVQSVKRRIRELSFAVARDKLLKHLLKD